MVGTTLYSHLDPRFPIISWPILLMNFWPYHIPIQGKAKDWKKQADAFSLNFSIQNSSKMFIWLDDLYTLPSVFVSVNLLRVWNSFNPCIVQAALRCARALPLTHIVLRVTVNKWSWECFPSTLNGKTHIYSFGTFMMTLIMTCNNL